MRKRAFIAAIVIIALAGALFLAATIAGRAADKRATAFVRELRLEHMLEWQDVSYNPFSHKISISHIKINSTPAILLDKIVLSDYKYPAFSLDLRGMQVPLTETCLGMDIRGDARAVVRPDATISIEDAMISGLGELEAEFRFDDGLQNILSSKVHGWARLKDNGLAQHIINLLARDLSTSEAAAKGRLLTGINNRLRQEPDNSNYINIYRYFDDPNQLTIRTRDDAAIKLRDFLPPSDVTGWRRLGDWAAELPVVIE